MRIVLDTNILISALMTQDGPPGRVVALAFKKGHVLITSTFQIAEMTAVIGRERVKPYIKPDQAKILMHNIDTKARVITDLPDIDLSPDPRDNPILAAAIVGKADFIASGDKSHVLALGQVEGIPIITAREALDRLIR